MRHLAAPLTLAGLILLADRASKFWVDKFVSIWDVWPVVPGFVNIIHAENPGMAFSLLSTASPAVRAVVLIGLATTVLAVVAVMLWRSGVGIERWALALVLGGAVGNLWDRIVRGTVTDFVDVYYRDWHWATFNVADSAITVGALVLALHMLTSPERKTDKTEAPATVFPKLISFSDSFFLPTYGALVAAGFLLALWVTGKLARQSGLDPDRVSNVGIYSALAGLVGAKLLMFVLDFDYFRQNPREAFSFATLQSGGVFFGGLVIAILAGAWLMRKYALPPLKTFDVFGPGLALGQGIGRLGCFAAGCCWGVKCDRAWAVRFTNNDANRITGVPLDVDLHPTQLYEAALLALTFLITWRLFLKPHRPGFIFGLYLILAAGQRFLVEFFREHQQANFGGGPLSNAQLISIGLMLGGVILMFRARQAQPA